MSDGLKFKAQLDGADKTVSNFNKIEKSLKKTESTMSKTKKSTDKTSYAMTSFSRLIQDLPYGLVGYANNIEGVLLSFKSLKQQTGGTSSALKAMLKSFTSPSGFIFAIPIAIGLFQALQNVFKSSAEKAKELGEAFDSARQGVRKLRKENSGLVKDLERLEKTQARLFMKQERNYKYYAKDLPSAYRKTLKGLNSLNDFMGWNEVMTDKIRVKLLKFAQSGQLSGIMMTKAFEREVLAAKALGKEFTYMSFLQQVMGADNAKLFRGMRRNYAVFEKVFHKYKNRIEEIDAKSRQRKGKDDFSGYWDTILDRDGIRDAGEAMAMSLNPLWMGLAGIQQKAQESFLYVKDLQEDLANTMLGVGTMAINTMGQAYADFFYGLTSGSKKAFSEYARAMLKSLAVTAAQKSLFYLAEGIAASIFWPDKAGAMFAASAIMAGVAAASGAAAGAMPNHAGGGGCGEKKEDECSKKGETGGSGTGRTVSTTIHIHGDIDKTNLKKFNKTMTNLYDQLAGQELSG